MTSSSLVLLLLLGVLAVVLISSLFFLLDRKRRKALLVVLSVVLAVPTLLVLSYTTRQQIRVEVAPSRPELEPADDLSRWQSDAVLGFQPESPSGLESWVGDAAGARLARERLKGGREVHCWHPGAGGQLAAYSSPQATRDAALAEAAERARDKLAVLAVVDLERSRGIDAATVEPLARRIAGRGEFLVELASAVEEAWRPHARYYRAAVLVRAEPARIAELGRRIQDELQKGWLEEQERMRAWLLSGAGAVLLAIALFLVYVFLNAGTKGYFAWPLRIASAAVFALVVLCAWFLRAKLGLG
jgi:hypothetical protein